LPELRKDPISARWVIISTERAKRPTDLVRESVQIRGNGFCPFCYGNEGKTPPEGIRKITLLSELPALIRKINGEPAENYQPIGAGSPKKRSFANGEK